MFFQLLLSFLLLFLFFMHEQSAAPISVCKCMQAHIYTEFRCCCFTRRCLKTVSAFLVLPRVHSPVNVFVRASTRDGLITQPDQAQGFSKNA
jgi:hypothetical protein